MSEQLDALCDSSPVLAPARLKRHKECAAELQQAAAATEDDLRQTVHSLQLLTKHLRKRLRSSRAEMKALKQQLEAAQAGQLQ